MIQRRSQSLPRTDKIAGWRQSLGSPLVALRRFDAHPPPRLQRSRRDVKHALGSRFALSVVLVGCALAAPAPALAVNATLWVPEGVSKLRGIIACTSVGLGSGWCKSADFQALAKKLEV